MPINPTWDQAMRRKQVFLSDWLEKLEQFLKFNDRDVLPDAGRVGKHQAEKKAYAEYDHYALQQRAHKELRGAQDMDTLLKWQRIQR